MTAASTETRYTADQLAALTQTPRRTIRYYIQLALVDRPIGETRAAYYTDTHARQLLEIRRLTEAGLSLEAIQARGRGAESPVNPAPGSLRVLTHLQLAPGLELVIDPSRAALPPEHLRRFTRELLDLYARIHTNKEPS